MSHSTMVWDDELGTYVSKGQLAFPGMKEKKTVKRLVDETYIPSGIAGGHVNSNTGKSSDDDGKTLDKNGWPKGS